MCFYNFLDGAVAKHPDGGGFHVRSNTDNFYRCFLGRDGGTGTW